MERLTKRCGEYVEIVGCKSLYDSAERKNAPASSAIARLTNYEDTGLTPDEVKTILAERDALLEALHGSCRDCMHHSWKIEGTPCKDCYFCSIHFNEPPNADSGLSDNWQWRGTGGSDGT